MDIKEELEELRDLFNQPSPKEVAAFIAAAGAGNEQAVRDYCKKHPDYVDATNKEGQTALQAAAEKNQVAAGAVLLDAKADPNKPAQFGENPFQTHIGEFNHQLGDYRFLDMLLKAGAKINIQRTMIYEGENKPTLTSALMGAAYDGDKKLCEYLIKHGADPTLKDKDGQTARAYAISAARTWMSPKDQKLMHEVAQALNPNIPEYSENGDPGRTKKSLRNTATFLKKAQKEWVKRKSSVELKM